MVGRKCNEYKSYTSTKKVNEIYFRCFKGGILNWCKFSIIEYSCHWVSSKGN